MGHDLVQQGAAAVFLHIAGQNFMEIQLFVAGGKELIPDGLLRRKLIVGIGGALVIQGELFQLAVFTHKYRKKPQPLLVQLNAQPPLVQRLVKTELSGPRPLLCGPDIQRQKGSRRVLPGRGVNRFRRGTCLIPRVSQPPAQRKEARAEENKNQHHDGA